MPRIAVRALCLCVPFVAALSPAVAASALSPRDVVAAIYAREIAESKKAAPGTAFTEPSMRARFFSKSFDSLITKAEMAAEKAQDAGPVDFDPILSGQDGEVKKLKVETETTEGDKAIVAAKFLNFGQPTKVTFVLVRDASGWRVDDIRGSIGSDRWSVRKILNDAERPK